MCSYTVSKSARDLMSLVKKPQIVALRDSTRISEKNEVKIGKPLTARDLKITGISARLITSHSPLMIHGNPITIHITTDQTQYIYI